MLARQLFEKIKSEAENVVRFEQRSCLRTRFNKNECRVCLNECKAGALELNGRTLSFDAEKCAGCMRCVAVCPNDAFIADLDMLQLLKNIQTQQLIVISCRNKEQFVPHENIQCIGALSEPLLASMNSLTKGKVFLDVTQCNSCSNGHCLERIKLSLDTLMAKEAAIDRLVRIKLVPDEEQFPEVDGKQSRRFFLKGVGSAIADFGIETCSKAMQKSDTEKQSPKKGPVKNSVFLQYALDNTADEEERIILESFFYNVQADEQCNLCPVCSGMCPTGALKRKNGNGKKHLVFKSADCSGCGLCRDYCKKQALSISKGFVGNTKESRKLN
jgi:MinD superfamily P-loop ATPase